MREDLSFCQLICISPKLLNSRSWTESCCRHFHRLTGGIAAEALYLAAKGEPFMSKDDIAQRAKVSRSTLDVMGELGLLGDLPESNQLSIFDLKIG